MTPVYVPAQDSCSLIMWLLIILSLIAVCAAVIMVLFDPRLPVAAAQAGGGGQPSGVIALDDRRAGPTALVADSFELGRKIGRREASGAN